MRRDLAIGCLLTVLTLIAFGQAPRCGFVAFDDATYVYNNPNVRQGLTWPAVGWAFTTGETGNWHPLTWLSLMLDVACFGINSAAHHGVNLGLHVVNTLLLFGFLRWTTARPWSSAMVAALFAVHPLHVESVAWVSERKDVLSTSFGFLALLAYAIYVRRPSVARYLPVFFLLALALLAKPMWVTLPFMLLLLDVWPLGRRGVGEKGRKGEREEGRKGEGEKGSGEQAGHPGYPLAGRGSGSQEQGAKAGWHAFMPPTACRHVGGRGSHEVGRGAGRKKLRPAACCLFKGNLWCRRLACLRRCLWRRYSRDGPAAKENTDLRQVAAAGFVGRFLYRHLHRPAAGRSHAFRHGTLAECSRRELRCWRTQPTC